MGSNDWRSLAAIAGIDPAVAAFPSFAGELVVTPAHHVEPSLYGGVAFGMTAASADDSDSFLPVASSLDVTDDPDVDLQVDFDLAASPVPAILFVPDAFAGTAMRYAGSGRSTTRGTPGPLKAIAKHALGLAAIVTTFGVVFVSASTFLANTYGSGKADGAFVLPTTPRLTPASFEAPEPRLAEPRAAVPGAPVAAAPDTGAVIPAPAPVITASVANDKLLEDKPAPSVEEKRAPAAKAKAKTSLASATPASPASAPAPSSGVAISASERAWDSRRVVHRH